MEIFLAILAAFTFSFHSITGRAFQLGVQRNERDIKIFQAAVCTIGAVAYLISSIINTRFSFEISPIDVLSAVAFGVFFCLASLMSVLSFNYGPMSITSVITNASVVIPLLYSLIMLKEGITGWQIAGFILLMCTFVFSALGGKKNENSKYFTWFILVIISFFSNGITAVLQKVYKLSTSGGDGNLYMAIAYGTAAIVFTIVFLVDRKVPQKGEKFRSPAKFALYSLIGGLGSFVGNAILMYLADKLTASVLYPIVNGGLCVIVTLASCIIFKEKLTKMKIVTIILGAASIIALNL